MNKTSFEQKNISTNAGVYFFLGKKKRGGVAGRTAHNALAREAGRPARQSQAPGVAGREVLYIGKAGSLRDRVRSYFAGDIGQVRSPAIAHMVEIAEDITTQETDSVLEALILEASLIKKYQPPYNVKEKDNKSFNYIAITDEAYPRVVVVRGRDIQTKTFVTPTKYLFGPFPQGSSLKEALSIVRKIFPFRDKCTPKDNLKDPQKAKACFNHQIGLCPGVCVGAVSKQEYRRTIDNIRLFFEGKKGMLLKRLEKEMMAAAKARDFEKADEVKKTIFALQHIQDVSLIKDDLRVAQARTSMRIEGYDVAHIQGSDTVGVMTIVEDGEAVPREYRLFTIREAKGGDDTGALAEVLSRRLGHPEWTMPKLIVVDGGTAQIRRAQKVLKEAGVAIPVVGVVKDEHHKPREIRGATQYRTKYEKEILLVNHEAHRFAIKHHRRRRQKRMR